MVNWNQWVLGQQKKNLLWVALGVIALLTGFYLLVPKKAKPQVLEVPLTVAGVVDESFSEADAESALTQQQKELSALKKQLKSLQAFIELSETKQQALIHQLVEEGVKSQLSVLPKLSETPATVATPTQRITPKLHAISFDYSKGKTSHALDATHYVPSGTFVRAVVLGGADADASVNGQSKNNGVMLFKLLEPGTLPNGQHSKLSGCFVTGSAYGDISSERAYVVLDKLSCARMGEKIIDKSVTGWAFFDGKVGIKGVPLMRDNKVMQWAGLSGALSGLASAAQYSQSIQSISPLGSSSVVPGSNVAPYAAYGGASKAAEVLSNYYVKRAEQYHPVIQVGSGNFVTIVFKDGFYLDEPVQPKTHTIQEPSDFEVPADVLSKINPTYIKGEDA